MKHGTAREGRGDGSEREEKPDELSETSVTVLYGYQISFTQADTRQSVNLK